MVPEQRIEEPDGMVTAALESKVMFLYCLSGSIEVVPLSVTSPSAPVPQTKSEVLVPFNPALPVDPAGPAGPSEPAGPAGPISLTVSIISVWPLGHFFVDATTLLTILDLAIVIQTLSAEAFGAGTVSKKDDAMNEILSRVLSIFKDLRGVSYGILS